MRATGLKAEGNAGTARPLAGARRAAKKNRTPAQPFVCEGAYAEKAQGTSYIKSLQTGFLYLILSRLRAMRPAAA